MKTFRNLALALATAGLITATAQAATLSGNIYFTGTATLNGLPGAATAITFDPNVDTEHVISTGSYAGLAASQTATFTNFAFGAVGNTGALAVTPLWTFTTGGGTTFSFNLNNLTLNSYTGTQRLLEGTGTATSSAFDSAPGFWTLSTSGTSAVVSFSSFTSVPDGGSTIALLGLALIGITALHRRFKSSNV